MSDDTAPPQIDTPTRYASSVNGEPAPPPRRPRQGDALYAREEWRDVPGYEGLYRVSDMGRVMTLSRRLVFRNGKQRGRVIPTKILAPTVVKDGHLRLTLCKLGIVKSVYVHSLVLLAFVGECPDGMECCHFPDRDPTNNRLDNLRWGTAADNAGDRVVHGSCAGANNGRAALTVEQVSLIRSLRGRLLSEYGFKTRLARELGVHASTVRRALKGETWNRLEFKHERG